MMERMKPLKPLFPLRAAMSTLMKIISAHAFGSTKASTLAAPLPTRRGNNATKYRIMYRHSGMKDTSTRGTTISEPRPPRFIPRALESKPAVNPVKDFPRGSNIMVSQEPWGDKGPYWIPGSKPTNSPVKKPKRGPP